MGWPDRHECFVIPSKHKAIRASSLSMEEILSSSVVMVKKQEGICLEDQMSIFHGFHQISLDFGYSKIKFLGEPNLFIDLNLEG
jgi:hypothetical protein